MAGLRYRRILLKLSGEALMGPGRFGIDPGTLARQAAEIGTLVSAGVQVGLVIGGGNIFRGAGLAEVGLGRVTGDQMGMLGTVMNALAMRDALERIGVPARVMSALAMPQVCESFSQGAANAALQQGQVVLFAAGTGNPFFTTDTAASLRAVEIGADLLVKATKVDGIYSADPVKVADALFYPRLSYDQAIREGLQVMDATALVLCRDHRLPLRVLNIHQEGALLRLVQGDSIGTLVEPGE